MRVLKYEGEVSYEVNLGIDISPIDNAFRLLRADEVQFIDLEDSLTGTLLQVAAASDDRYLIQVFPGGMNDERPGMFCGPHGVSYPAAHSFAIQFASTGQYSTALIPFSSPHYGPTTFPLTPQYEAARVDPEAERRAEVEENPQKYLNIVIKECCCNDCLPSLRYAIELGATLKRFKPFTPLAFHAIKSNDFEAIPLLISLGCEVNEMHDGNTIIWHAITSRHFAFASTLAFHGAITDTAKSSVNYSDWQAYESEQLLLRAIGSGDKAFVADRIKPLAKNRIKNDWLKHALMTDQFECFQILLQKKETVKVDVAFSVSLYGKALAKEDSRYLASLILHGAYASITQDVDPHWKQMAWSITKASPDSLRFLQNNDYTLGLREGLKAMVRRPTQKTVRQLDAIDDKLIHELHMRDFVHVVKCLSNCGPSARLTRLLAGVDNAHLLSSICDEGDLGIVERLIHAGVELAPIALTRPTLNAVLCRQLVQQTREKLIGVLQDIAST